MFNYHNPQTWELVRSRYKLADGQPFEMTDGQNLIFDCIFCRLFPRVEAITLTQYGKSHTAAVALVERCSNFAERWCIVAGSDKKAKIIMGYAIQHIFDNEYTAAKFETEGESRKRIQRERSKNRINFRLADGRLGELFIVSAQGQRRTNVLDAIMGFGSPNIVVDESSLIDDIIYAGIKRMLGGSNDTFLLELGNPFYRNHFLRTWRSEKYYKIFIDWQQALQEGRITKERVEEARAEAMFDVLYECQFPPEEALDKYGYRSLILEKDLDRSYRKQVMPIGRLRLGVDPAGEGQNYSVIVLRGSNAAKILYREHEPDTTVVAAKAVGFIRDFGVKGEDVAIDKVGLGKGVYDMVANTKEGRNCVGVAAGETATLTPVGKTRYFNKRAEMYDNTRAWLRVSEIERNDGWEDLLDVRYKIRSDRMMQIQPKEEMRKEGKESPDCGDALSLTFYTPEGANDIPPPPPNDYRELYPGVGG
ncbi:MAG: hypothetical protein PHI63_05945 [Patescibacteria group bacterium]|nr:hypothetical protein [Patescibacteria group bacterium]